MSWKYKRIEVMKKNIYDYFINLDKGSFVRDNNAILEVPDNMLMIDDCDDMCLINENHIKVLLNPYISVYFNNSVNF